MRAGHCVIGETVDGARGLDTIKIVMAAISKICLVYYLGFEISWDPWGSDDEIELFEILVRGTDTTKTKKRAEWNSSTLRVTSRM